MSLDDEEKVELPAQKILSRCTLICAPGQHFNETEICEQNLMTQFQYFRKDFLDTAISNGITVPIDLVEDTAGSFPLFMEHGGPQCVLQLLQTESIIHLQRVSLALLIVVISNLKRQLYNFAAETMASFAAAENLVDIVDRGAVSVCIHMVIFSCVEDIHKLSLNILTQLVLLSETASNQMFEEGIGTLSLGTSEHDKTSKPKTPTSKTILEMLSSPQKSTVAHIPHQTTRLSCLLTIIALYQNRLNLIASCADVLIALLVDGLSTTAVKIAKTCTCILPPITQQGVTGAGSKHAQIGESRVPPVSPSNWVGARLLVGTLSSLTRYYIGVQPTIVKAQDNFEDDSTVTTKTMNAFLTQDLMRAQAKILITLLKMISISSEVAAFLSGLAGAEEIVLAAIDTVELDGAESELALKCQEEFRRLREESLQETQRLKFLQENSHHHQHLGDFVSLSPSQSSSVTAKNAMSADRKNRFLPELFWRTNQERPSSASSVYFTADGGFFPGGGRGDAAMPEGVLRPTQVASQVLKSIQNADPMTQQLHELQATESESVAESTSNGSKLTQDCKSAKSKKAKEVIVPIEQRIQQLKSKLQNERNSRLQLEEKMKSNEQKHKSQLALFRTKLSQLTSTIQSTKEKTQQMEVQLHNMAIANMPKHSKSPGQGQGEATSTPASPALFDTAAAAADACAASQSHEQQQQLEGLVQQLKEEEQAKLALEQELAAAISLLGQSKNIC